jgi:RNA polymerase subunit RPABC4/transcription elongation factor Spt4/ABC-type Fe3+ transport system permease subunit
MTDYAQRASNSFNERMRLIRFRRKREKLRFWDEFKLVPRWLVAVVILLFILAQVIAYIVNTQGLTNNGEIFPPELRNNPTLASLALAGIITSVALVLGASLFLFGYVNRDAKRRGMNSTLWTLLVILLFPAYFALGFIIYFLMREPLPYPCPQCGNTVGARFNFCPNCKSNLYPACPQCKREVVETDKFCPYCGNDLKVTTNAVEVSAQNSV